MNIGCHVPISRGVDKAPEIAAKWGCEAMQIFTHSPSGGPIAEISDETANNFKVGIKKYSIDFVPTIILSKDAAAYGIIQQAWAQIGSKETDGSYVLRVPSPPFINLTTGKLRGIVNIIYLTDISCTECYDVSQHKKILVNSQSFAVKLEKEETYDISDAEGKELIRKYNITQVPTVILSDEINAYPSIQVLKQFYSIEKDESYVFRTVSVVGTYKDLINKKIVEFQQQSEEK